MAAASPHYDANQVTMNGSFVSIVAKIDCNLIGIYNTLSVDIKHRTDSADANTELTIHAGQWKQVGEASSRSSSFPNRGTSRFPKGSTICFLQAASGNVYVEFLL